MQEKRAPGQGNRVKGRIPRPHPDCPAPRQDAGGIWDRFRNGVFAADANPSPPKTRSPMSKQEKSLFMTFLMTPDMANFSGHIHGGSILKLLDQVAYACAARYCKNYVVTASLDQVIFKEPIKVGELVTFRANVNYVGRT